MNPSICPSRRAVLQALAVAALPAVPAFAQGADPWRGLKMGVATYTFRKFSTADTIAAIRKVGLQYASIKDFHAPMKSSTEERRATARQFKEGGVTPLSCGVVSLKNEEPAVRAAFEYTRDLGVPVMVCIPTPDSMPMLESFVREFNIKLAIHNHGPESKWAATPGDIWKVIEKCDPRIGFCMDVAHTVRSGGDPVADIRKFRDRLYDVHIRDIDQAAAKGRTIEAGRGVMNLKGILKALLDVKFAGHVGWEYEKDPDSPTAGLAESVEYTRRILASL